MTDTKRRALLAKVHIAVKELGYDDERYRDILHMQFNKKSASELNDAQLDELIKFFKKEKGWKSKKIGKKPAANRGTDNQMGKVTALLAAKGKHQGGPVPWNYAIAILKKLYGIDRLEWANKEHLQGLITALVQDAKRKGYHENVDYRAYQGICQPPAGV